MVTPNDSRHFARYVAVQIIGIFCIVVGVLGLVLPVVNGIIPLAAGVILIAMYNPPLHRYIQKLVETWPWLERLFGQIEEFLERVFGPAPEGTPPMRSKFPKYQHRMAEKMKATAEGSETTDL